MSFSPYITKHIHLELDNNGYLLNKIKSMGIYHEVAFVNIITVTIKFWGMLTFLFI